MLFVGFGSLQNKINCIILFQKEDELLEHSWKENSDSSLFNKTVVVQSVNFTYTADVVTDDPNNAARLSLIEFLVLKVVALQKMIIEGMRMKKDKEKSESSFSIKGNEQNLRLTDFSRCYFDSVWDNTCIKLKERCETHSPILLENMDAANTYSIHIKELIMSLEYIWYAFES